MDISRLCWLEPDAAADNIGTHSFKSLFPASSKKRWEGLKYSIRSFGPLASEAGYYSLVHACAETGRDRLIRYLIRKRVNIDQRDQHGRTPLLKGLEEGHETVVKALLQNGADVNVRGKEDETALVVAIVNGRANIIRLLLENRGDVWARGRDGIMPMHGAANGDHVDATNALKEAGADVTAKDGLSTDTNALGSEWGPC